MKPDPEIYIKSENPASTREETRQKLIEAGLEIFGKMGYEAATTRMITQNAGVNLAAIPYHFGSKEGLYHAVIQYISDTVSSNLKDERTVIMKVVMNPAAKKTDVQQALESMIRAFAKMVISTTMGEQFGPIIMREHMQPSSAFDRLYLTQMEPLHEAVTVLISRLIDIPPDSPEAIIRAHSILGQVVAFRALRDVALRRTGWKSFDHENLELVLDTLIDNVRRIVKSPGKKK